MILKNNFLVSDAVQTLEFLVVATMTVLCCGATFFSFFSHFTANVERNTQVRRNYTTPHKTQMIDTTINLLVNRTEYTNLSGTTLTLRLAVKSDNSSPAILFRDSEKLDATIKLSLTLPTVASDFLSLVHHSFFWCDLFVRLICAIDLCNSNMTSSSATRLSMSSAYHPHGIPFLHIPEFPRQCSQVSNWYSHDISHVLLIVM